MCILIHTSRRRTRTGRLLIEALVALVLAAAVLVSSASLAGSALAMSDAAQQLDVAATSEGVATADALRGPCTLTDGRSEMRWSVRHRSEHVRAAGAIARVRVADAWRTVGVGRHDSLAIAAHIGVRCD
jgi:hypothetical protein